MLRVEQRELLGVAEDLWLHLRSGEGAQGARDPRAVAAGRGRGVGALAAAALEPGRRDTSSGSLAGQPGAGGCAQVPSRGRLVCAAPRAGLWSPGSASPARAGAHPAAAALSTGHGDHVLRWLPLPRLCCHRQARPRDAGPGPLTQAWKIPPNCSPREADAHEHGLGRATVAPERGLRACLCQVRSLLTASCFCPSECGFSGRGDSCPLF